ncbi:MAG TPA: hypothetical protein VH877_02770 [Polyangia bacterium]|jgi:tetratricopeptide (TPR) repeat protein|nr:hypothetical protein [Polyangia bacterium]
MHPGRVLLLGILLTAASVRADEAAEAKRHFISGTRHYNLNEYEEALQDFKEAYRHKDDPVFLYNIAQCYRLLDKHEEAVRFYRSYLRVSPNAPNRKDVEHKIATLEELIAAQGRARSAPPSGVQQPTTPALTSPGPVPAAAGQEQPSLTKAVAPAPPPSKSAARKWWVWTLVGAGVGAGLGVGLGVGLTQNPTVNSFPGVQF